MIYFCCDERRRDAVREHATLNGIDFLEVFDDALPPQLRQRLLFVHFIKQIAPGDLSKSNIRIEGGERITNIQVINITHGLTPPILSPPQSNPNVLAVELSEPGDFSIYTLRLVKGPNSSEPPGKFDPILSAVDFSFKVTCESKFDCKTDSLCPAEPAPPMEIDYIARDYASFRQLMLDRMAALMPAWTERNPADLGIALVEMLAYAGDYLSYQQDAVATESYLATARRRVSIRRLARLIDHSIHNGRNARVWIQLKVRDDVSVIELMQGEGRTTTKFLTRVDGPTLILQGSKPYDAALAARPLVFELMRGAKLYAAHNQMKFYTWGDRACCLPRGAIRATLRGSFPNLSPGDALIFQEARGPETGEASDADPTHRVAVRLSKVTLSSDPLGGRFEDPETDDPVAVTEIEWDPADALPFPLCISSRKGTAFFEDVSVALGNVVLADHGMTFTDEPDGRPFDPFKDATSLEPPVVPSPNPALTKVKASSGDRCKEHEVLLTPQRYYPRLKQSPLTHAAGFDPSNPLSANATINLPPVDQNNIPMPVIHLTVQGSGPGAARPWNNRRDLLNSGAGEEDFVVEVESDGSAFLRFGDDRLGSRPAPGTRFLATYRIGNGIAGNIGCDAMAHLVSNDTSLVDLSGPLIVAVTNPLPASEGVDSETIEQVRQTAPSAFRKQERAVTPDDYAEVSRRCEPDIQRAAATFRWTGSWRTVFLTVDRIEGRNVDDIFENRLRRCLERYRMAGHDVEVAGPIYVSIEVEMIVCVKRNYFVSDIKKKLLDVFSNRELPDGRQGIFHPNKFTFGQPVYLSLLYAAAQAVEGVEAIHIPKFQRQGIDSTEAIETGRLELQRLEIARLDNDPNFPERGVFRLTLEGGQ